MKRVNFGHKGGFPLEQETLIHLQRAYANDMLDALLAQWGVDTTKNYLLKDAVNDTDDGWIITTIQREEVNAKSGVAFLVTKPELLRLKFNGGKKAKIEILDLRIVLNADGSVDNTSNGGYLAYADASAKRVYEEFAARYTTTKVSYAVKEILFSSLIPLKSIVELGAEITNLEENYLPRDGSKPMTGDLDLGSNQLSKLDTNETFNASVRSADFSFGYSSRRGTIYPDRPLGRALVDNGKALHLNYAQDWEQTYINGDVFLPNLKKSSSQIPLVIDSNGNIGEATGSIITPQATTRVSGKAEIATQTEVNVGTDNTKIVTPDTLNGLTATTTRRGIAEVATTVEVNDGDFDDRHKIVSPYYLSRSNYAQIKLEGIIYLSIVGSSTRPFVTGGFQSVVPVDLGEDDSRYRVTFTSPILGNYYPVISIETADANDDWNDGNDAIFTLREVKSEGFEVLVREVSKHNNTSHRVRVQILQKT